MLLSQDFNVVIAYRRSNDKDQILWFFGAKLNEGTDIYIDFFSNTDDVPVAVVYDDAYISSLFGDSEPI